MFSPQLASRESEIPSSALAATEALIVNKHWMLKSLSKLMLKSFKDSIAFGNFLIISFIHLLSFIICIPLS